MCSSQEHIQRDIREREQRTRQFEFDGPIVYTLEQVQQEASDELSRHAGE